MWKLLNGVIRFFNPEEQEKPTDEPLIQAVSRRGFLKGLGAIAVTQAIPFNRVWSFPTVIRPYNPYAGALCLRLENIRDQLPVLYERDDTLFDLINRKTWNSVPWDSEMQWIGSGVSIETVTQRHVLSAMRTFEDKLRSARAEAHRVLPLPE